MVVTPASPSQAPFVATYLLGRSRAHLIRALAAAPDQLWTVAELQRRTGLAGTSIQREMHALNSVGLLERRRQNGSGWCYRWKRGDPVAASLATLTQANGPVS